MRSLVTGATGFIGRRLVAELQRPVVLSRNPDAAAASLAAHEVEAFRWDGLADVPPADAFQEVETIFHLAGDPVAEGRWTAAKKERIRESRVTGTRNLVAAMEALETRPRLLVSASAVGYYGSRGGEILDESSSPGDDFLAQVCVDWEREARRAEDLGVRVVLIRIGIVLGTGGGALAKMLTPFKLCVGGRLGNGHQWMPWIHVDDLVALLRFAESRDDLRGPVNGVSPKAVTNRKFTKTLATVLGRPAIFPAPGFALRTLIGEFAEILLASSHTVPRVAQDAEFQFRFPDLQTALTDILGRGKE